MAEQIPGRGVVIVASTRAARGVYRDETGPRLASWLEGRGLEVGEPRVVADRDVAAAVAEALAPPRPRVLITTGGTGIGPEDQTVEAVYPHLERELPGIVQELIRRGVEHGPASAVLTRGVAGLVGDTFVATLPGSPGAVEDGVAVIDPILGHLVGQARGGENHANHGSHGNHG